MKIDDYIIKVKDRNLRDFVDQATLIFNYGKYSAQTVLTPPQWVARNGEFVFFSSSTSSGNRVYFYANNQWNWMAGSPTGGGTPAGFEPMVQWNSGGLFAADSGFQYVSHSALLIGTGTSLVYNSDSGANTRTVYTIANNYLEFYVNGEIRLQM